MERRKQAEKMIVGLVEPALFLLSQIRRTVYRFLLRSSIAFDSIALSALRPFLIFRNASQERVTLYTAHYFRYIRK